MLSVTDEVGMRTVVDTLLESTRNENADQRRAAATLLCAFCANSKAQYTNHVPQLLRGLIHLCTDSDRDVLHMSWEALNATTKVGVTKVKKFGGESGNQCFCTQKKKRKFKQHH